VGEAVLMKERVLAELARVEREKGVRVLLAVESGSRAWGFASPDSDYDVRFIYSHPSHWYLSVFEGRDVIEEMLPGDLDVSGWELRKALRLFSKCNLALNEWLGSPLVYCGILEFRQALLELLPQVFNPIAGIHHYRSMATQAFESSYVEGRIGIKKLFYVLRPLLACRWIERWQGQPPTAFAELLVEGMVTSAEREWIEELLSRKADAREAESVELEAVRADGIAQELERYKASSAGIVAGQRSDMRKLDEVLRAWVA
jgi:predicted nucleotidyltransferase